MSQVTCLDRVCIWVCYLCLKHFGEEVINCWVMLNTIIHLFCLYVKYIYIYFTIFLTCYVFIFVFQFWSECFCFVAGVVQAYRGKWESPEALWASNFPFFNLWLLVSYGLWFPPLSWLCFCTPLTTVFLSDLLFPHSWRQTPLWEPRLAHWGLPMPLVQDLICVRLCWPELQCDRTLHGTWHTTNYPQLFAQNRAGGGAST